MSKCIFVEYFVLGNLKAYRSSSCYYNLKKKNNTVHVNKKGEHRTKYIMQEYYSMGGIKKRTKAQAMEEEMDEE